MKVAQLKCTFLFVAHKCISPFIIQYGMQNVSGGRGGKYKICVDASDVNLCYLFLEPDRSENNFISSNLDHAPFGSESAFFLSNKCTKTLINC